MKRLTCGCISLLAVLALALAGLLTWASDNNVSLRPALIAELRAARRVCELITLWAGVEMTTLHPDIAEALDAWQKARDQ